jgi:Domain of unknown function (DUF6434)/SAP domain-containing new25
MTQHSRPAIQDCRTGADLRQWYWLKAELMAECSRLRLPGSGGKFDLLDRLCAYRDKGVTIKAARPRTTSKFDWHAATLTPQTILTDSYRNTQNVRRFFTAHADPRFKFSIALMEWMRANAGKTLADALNAYHSLQAQAAAPGFQTQIKPHNQWNAYLRAFRADNPDLGVDVARAVWQRKRGLPSSDGRHTYDPADLLLRN